MKGNFENAMRGALQRGDGLADYLPILLEFRRRGLSRADALDVLEALRTDADDAVEDRILEVMDIVFGNCAPHNRVWRD